MGRRRKCTVVGCQSIAGLHGFPENSEFRRQWLRAIGLGEDSELPVRAGVCHLHFSPDSFSNYHEVQMGFGKQLRLKSEAIPTLTLGQPRPPRPMEANPIQQPLPRPPLLTPRHPAGALPRLEPKTTQEIGCQTDAVHTIHPPVQAGRSKEILMEVQFPNNSRTTSSPLKRKRCEVSASDPSFHLDGSASSLDCTSTPIQVPPYKQKKYIVHENQLLELFRTCPVCTRHCVTDTVTVGTLLQVKQHCPHCDYFKEWSSQPTVNSIPAGDLQLCAAVLFTGSSFRQISKFLKAFNVQGLSEQCFYRYQAKLLIPTVSWQWKLEQDELIMETVGAGPVTLGGDMRLDSPGHSAKYGSYTMMNLKSNHIIDIQLVQSNEVGNSVRMEEEGFVRSLNVLEERGVEVLAVVTDRHSGVQKYLRDQKPAITHFFDPWHMGKGIGKKMDELGKKRGAQDVALWRKSVENHLYRSASTSSSCEAAVAKWTSVANHLQNVHTHENALFPRCLHGPMAGEEAKQRLKPSTAACEKLTAILLAPRFLKDVAKISPQYRISQIKAFHSLVTSFSPKSVGFSFKGMLARLQVAALHYNENATLSHSSAATRELRYAVECPKYKHGDYTVRVLKSNPTSFYIDKLMTLLFESVVEDARPYQESAAKHILFNAGSHSFAFTGGMT